MFFRKRSESDRDRFIVLLLKDDQGQLLDVKKHPGEWTVEDEQVRTSLEQHAERIASTSDTVGGRTEVSRTDTGKRIYLVAIGAAVRIEAAVEGNGWKELERRFSYAMRSMLNTQLARLKTGRSLAGPITTQNLLNFVIEGDAAFPPNLKQPDHFEPL